LRAGEKLVLEDNIVVQKVLHASAGDPGASISAQAAKEFAAGLKTAASSIWGRAPIIRRKTILIRSARPLPARCRRLSGRKARPNRLEPGR